MDFDLTLARGLSYYTATIFEVVATDIVPEKTRRHKKGDVLEAFSGYCRPAQFDITGALKTGDNQFTILCERTWLNELGTGGLMGPVVVYRER